MNFLNTNKLSQNEVLFVIILINVVFITMLFPYKNCLTDSHFFETLLSKMYIGMVLSENIKFITFKNNNNITVV